MRSILGLFALVLGGLWVFVGGLRTQEARAQWLIFQSDRASRAAFYRINPEKPQQLYHLRQIPYDALYASWSPDARWIVFASNRDVNEQLYGIPSGGGRRLRLTNSALSDFEPAFSPDGAWLVFASNRDLNPEIYKQRLDAAVTQRLTHHDAYDISPVWSPNGAWIAFTSRRDGNWEIYKMRPDGTETQNLTLHFAADSEPAWSPDSRYLVFSSSRAGGAELYTLCVDCAATAPQRLTTSNGESTSPAWSPDGAWIAFMQAEGLNRDIYRIRPHGSDLQRLTHHTNTDYEPQWSPLVDLPFRAGWLGLALVGCLLAIRTRRTIMNAG